MGAACGQDASVLPSVTVRPPIRYGHGMRLAVCDPVYLGQSRRYPEHPDSGEWDRPETHVDMLHALSEYDGWVYACNVPMLRLLLPLCPESVRVGVWAKSRAGGRRPNVRVGYAHEHVLFQQPQERRGGAADMRRTDTLIAPTTRQTGVVGAKPESWTHWVLDLLGYDPESDTVDDLFPGSGAVGEAVTTYRRGCHWCTRPLNNRRGARYCSDRCRVAAFRSQRRRAEQAHG